MRLHELEFPIAILFHDGIYGGRHGRLSNRLRSFSFAHDEEFLNGLFDDAIIYNSSGRRMEILSIELTQTDWWRRMIRRADFFFIFPDRAKGRFAKVDMELKETGLLSLAEFKDEIKNIVLAHPQWWKRHSSKSEIQSMFDGCGTFKDAFDDIGYLEAYPEMQSKGVSKLAVDLRKK